MNQEISKYLSKDYFNPCDQTQDNSENGLDDSLLVSPLLTDYIGNITGRSKSRSARKKMRDQTSLKSATKIRKRLVDKFSDPNNDTSFCSTPGSDHDSILDASGFSLGLGSPDANMSMDKLAVQDKTESRLYDVRDITIFENEEFFDVSSNDDRDIGVKTEMEERSNESNTLGIDKKVESNDIHSEKKVGCNDINQDAPQSELKDKSFSLQYNSNDSSFEEYIVSQENFQHRDDSMKERKFHDYEVQDNEVDDLNLKLSLSPINLNCSNKESSNDNFKEFTIKTKEESFIDDRNLKTTETTNRYENNTIENKKEQDCGDKLHTNQNDLNDLLSKINSTAPIISFHKECNFNVEKGFFLNDEDECDLSKVSEIECCSSVSSTEVGAGLKLNDLDAIIDKKLLNLDVDLVDNDSIIENKNTQHKEKSDGNIDADIYEETTMKALSFNNNIVDSNDITKNETINMDTSPDSLQGKDLKRQKLSCSQDTNKPFSGLKDEVTSLTTHIDETNNEKKIQHDVCKAIGQQSVHEPNAIASTLNTIANREENLRRSYSDSDFAQGASNSVIGTDDNSISLSDNDADMVEFKLSKPGRSERRRSSMYSTASNRRDSLINQSQLSFEEKTKLRDLSSVRKRITASSSALIEKLQGETQKRKLHFSRSLKERNYDHSSCSSIDSLTNEENKSNGSSKIGSSSKAFENKMSSSRNENDDSINLSRNPKRNSSKLSSSKGVLPTPKKKPSKHVDSYIPFKARPVPIDSSRSGQAGVPKIEPRPVTVPCSPKLGRVDDRPSKAISKVKAEFRNKRRLLTKVPAPRPPPKPSTVKQAALNAKPFQRVLAGVEASKAKELVIQRALEKEEAENRKLSMFQAKPFKPSAAILSPASNCTQNSSLIGINLLDDSTNISQFDMQRQENIPPNNYTSLRNEASFKNPAKNTIISSNLKPPTLHTTERAKKREEFETHRVALAELRKNEKEKKRQELLKEKIGECNKLRNRL